MLILAPLSDAPVLARQSRARQDKHARSPKRHYREVVLVVLPFVPVFQKTNQAPLLAAIRDATRIKNVATRVVAFARKRVDFARNKPVMPSKETMEQLAMNQHCTHRAELACCERALR